MEINLTIMSGCFAVQSNIKPEKLYHQIVKKELEKNLKYILNINILRYERFASCFEKIKNYAEVYKIDVLLFQIRTEQFLRISKLYYTYSDEDKKKKRALTLPFLNRVPPENHDLLQLNLTVPTNNKERQKIYNRIKIYLNYFFGMIAGNRRYALKKYEELIFEVITFCKEKNIKLIFLGPGSRPHISTENKIAGKLHYYFKTVIENKNIPFISFIGEKNENNEPIFFENGIHVNENGHRKAATLLTEKIKEVFSI
ncbi:MAG: hypothetical protein KBG21_10685 [Ignavibacteria bacterium]|nr:hypothetical protein [Ignavibacteria bacterium]